MTDLPVIAVVCGGTSPERAVSLGSGKAVAEAMDGLFPVERFELDAEALPAGLESRRHVVLSTLHGSFGEDGGFQAILDEAGIEYAGCDQKCSALTFDKALTKSVLSEAGIPVADQIIFDRTAPPSVSEVVERLGQQVVLKPVRQGSSIGLAFARSESEIATLFDDLKFDDWMLETLIVGRELSLGVIEGEVMEIVEISPKSGQFDYASKYTKGMTEYEAPARLSAELEREIKAIAAATYNACGCRDYARVDVMLDGEGRPYVLEVNTLPGMKETSLMPMSAGAAGLSFKALLKKLVEPAILRFRSKYSIC